MMSEAAKKKTTTNNPAAGGDALRSDMEDGGHTDDEGATRSGEMRKAKTKEKRGHRRVDTKGVVTYKRVRRVKYSWCTAHALSPSTELVVRAGTISGNPHASEKSSRISAFRIRIRLRTRAMSAHRLEIESN